MTEANDLETDAVPQEPLDTEPVNPDEPVDPDVKMGEQIATVAGRIIKKHMDESIMPAINEMRNQPAQPQVPAQLPDDVNQRLQEKIFSGDVTGAFKDFLAMENQSVQAKTQQTNTAAKQAITSLSAEPYYKEIYPDMEELTNKNLSEGYPPKAAADMAYQTAKARHLEAKLGGGGGDNLGMTGGSTRAATRTGKVKLAPQFEAAAKRDIADGKFEDRQDYINHLSPEIREKYGM